MQHLLQFPSACTSIGSLWICEKEIAFLMNNYPPLCSYYVPITSSSAIKLTTCTALPSSFPVLCSNSIFKKLPRLPSNNIMLLSLTLLQLADIHSSLLIRLKLYCYSDTLQLLSLLDPLLKPNPYSPQMLAIKRLFVQFFNLVSSYEEKQNKIEKLMYRYPVMQTVFVLVVRRILIEEGVGDAGNLQLPVPTVWVGEAIAKVFGLQWRAIGGGWFEMELCGNGKDSGENKKVVFQDASYIYKVSNQEKNDVDFDRDFERILNLLDDEVVQNQSKLIVDNHLEKDEYVMKSYIPSLPTPSAYESLKNSSRPPSNKHFQFKTRGKIEQPVALFPRKQPIKPIQIFSTPLSFERISSNEPSEPLSITSFTAILENSSYANLNKNYKSTHTPSSSIPHSSKQLSHQRSNSSHNLLPTVTLDVVKSSSFSPIRPHPINKPIPVPMLERQKSYQGLLSQFSQEPNLSPQKRSGYKKTEEISRVTSPLSYFNYQQLLSKNSLFMDRRWNLNLGKANGNGMGDQRGMGSGLGKTVVEQYRFGQNSYKFAY